MMVLPDNWQLVRLRDVAETALGKMLDAARPRGASRVPYLRNLNVQWGGIDLDDVQNVLLSDEEKERFALAPGDLLVCEGGEIGRAAIWRGGSGYMGYQKALHRIRGRGQLDLRFLRYLLEHYANTGELRKRATGSTILHLPQRQLRQLPVPLPSINEQRRIVEILEDHLSRLDAALALLAASRRRCDMLMLSSVSTSLFGHAMWPTVPLSSVLDKAVGGVWGSATGVAERNVSVLRVTDLKPNGEIEPEGAAKRSITAAQLESRELELGDLLLEKSGGGPTQPVGRVGYVDRLTGPSVCSNFMQLLRPKPQIIQPRYLFWYLHGFYLRGGTQPMQKASTNIRNLKASDYLRLPVPVPPLHVQGAVAERLDEHLVVTSRAKAFVARTRQHEMALRRALLRAAFAGDLTQSTSEPADHTESTHV